MALVACGSEKTKTVPELAPGTYHLLAVTSAMTTRELKQEFRSSLAGGDQRVA